MTQKEIAETLNVSIATVSLALSDSPKISDITKEKIKDFVRVVKYRPNVIAKNLATGKTWTIGIIFPSITHSFYGELVREIQLNLKDKNYIGFYLPIEIFEKNQDAIDILLNRKVDGIIATQFNIEEVIRLQDEKIPIVLYKFMGYPIDIDYVEIDEYKGGVLVAQHLIKSGYKKFGFIGYIGTKRYAGYRDIIYQNNLIMNNEWIKQLGDVIPTDSRESGYEGMKKILLLKDKPEAVFAFNDMTAIGAMRAVYEAGLKVPEDIAIVGFDDIEEAKYLNIALTTVNTSKKEIAKKLVEVILEKIENKDKAPIQKIIIEPELVVRESCGFYLKNKLKDMRM